GCNIEDNVIEEYTVTSTSISYSGVLKSSKVNTFPIVDGMVINVVNGQYIDEGSVIFSMMDKQASLQYETNLSDLNFTKQDLDILVKKINILSEKLNKETDETNKQMIVSELESLKEQEISLNRTILKQDSIIKNIIVEEQKIASFAGQVKITDENITIESNEKQAIISLSNVIINDFNKDIAYKLLIDNVTYDLVYQSEILNKSKSNETQAFYDIAFNIVNADKLRNGYPVEIKSSIEKIYVPDNYVIEKNEKMYVSKDGIEVEINAVKIDTRYEVIEGLNINDVIELPIKEKNDKTN
ncbi:MAG: hypothetical protein ACRC5R_01505, partial [Mycoplasmatales bacterium]